MMKLIAGLTMVVSLVAFSPQPTMAQEGDCAAEYTKCLNDTWHLKGLLQVMADISCFAEYTGCIAKEVTG